MIRSAVLGYCKVVCLEIKTLLVRILLSVVFSSMKRCIQCIVTNRAKSCYFVRGYIRNEPITIESLVLPIPMCYIYALSWLDYHVG